MHSKTDWDRPIGSYGYALKSREKRGDFLAPSPLIGSLGIAIGYAIIVGWVLRYLFGSLSGVMMGMEAEVYFSQATGHFGSVPWHFMVVAITMAVLVGGVLKGDREGQPHYDACIFLSCS